MQITQQGNQFIAEQDGQTIGHIQFRPHDAHTIITDHTYVDPNKRGQKVAQHLLDALVDYAREENVKIWPQCSYVAQVFNRFTDKYQDVDARHSEC